MPLLANGNPYVIRVQSQEMVKDVSGQLVKYVIELNSNPVRVADIPGVQISSLFPWPRTGDEDIDQSLGALLPIRAGCHAGHANQGPN